ncbi:uncharacterized protein LOC119407236 [Rhipicephalus sanguineus]|uniref:uncharacterized protein LOC119407236 n=1 Tax=Rhipicephalus sanguineus TaxID=34632 RepID=UPI001894338C|nr:uncharacterized protein LOC119407236 [Rhipicephalus sanguineus]
MVHLRIARWLHFLLTLAVLANSGAKRTDAQARSNQSTEKPADHGGRDLEQRSGNNVKENASRIEGKSGGETQNKYIASAKEDTGNAGMNIMQREAPLIKDVEAKIDEGKEMERNLTAIREALLREISGVDGTGGASPLRRIQMKKRLRELEQRIADLHSKNEEAQQRFRGFVSAIDSGEIQDEVQARSALGRIYDFCNTAVGGAVRACRVVFAGVRRFFYDKVLGGIANVFHNLLGSRWQSLKAGVNLLAGI